MLNNFRNEYDTIKEHLRSTYQDGTHVEQSINILKSMNNQNSQLFLNLLIQIVITESDLNLKKAAIIHIKGMDFESIFTSFVKFSRDLPPELHSIVAILSEQLVKINPEKVLNFIENSDDSDIIMKKMHFMLLYLMLPLKDSMNYGITICLNSIQKNCQFLGDFLKENQNLDANMIVFFDYFLRCFDLVKHQRQFITESNFFNFFNFFHYLTCFTFEKCILFVDTDIAGRCVSVFNYFISKAVQIKNSEFISSLTLKIKEVILNYEKFVSITKLTIPEMFLLFNYYLKNIIVFTDIELTQKILIHHVFPQFELKVNYADFSVDQFLDDNHPTIESNSFYEGGVVSLNLLPNSDIISQIVFEFVNSSIDVLLGDPNLYFKEIYHLFNFISKFLKIDTVLNRNNTGNFLFSKILPLMDTNYTNPFLPCAVCNFIEHVPSQLMYEAINKCAIFLKNILLSVQIGDPFNELLLHFAFKSIKEIFISTDIKPLFSLDEFNLVFQKAFLLTQSLPNTYMPESFKFLCIQYFPPAMDPILIINTLWGMEIAKCENVSNFIDLFDTIFCQTDDCYKRNMMNAVSELLYNEVNSDHGDLFLKQCFDAIINLLFDISDFFLDLSIFIEIGKFLLFILEKINIYDHSTEIVEPYSSFSMSMTKVAKSAEHCPPILEFIMNSMRLLNFKADQINQSIKDEIFTFSFEGLYAPLIKFKGDNGINSYFLNNIDEILQMKYLEDDSKNNFESSLYLSFPQLLLESTDEAFSRALNFNPEPLLLIFVDEVLQILRFYNYSQNNKYNARVEQIIYQYKQRTNDMNESDINDEDNDEDGDIGIFLNNGIFDEGLKSKMISIHQIISSFHFF